MENIITKNKEAAHAFATIHDFFDSYSVWEALKQIDSIILASVSHKIWQVDTPASLLFFMNLLHSLSKAGGLIVSHNAIRSEHSIDLPEPTKSLNTFKNAQFVNATQYSTVWNCFPRHLTFIQLKEPYEPLKKFVKFITKPKYSKLLEDIIKYALSNNSIDNEYSLYEILTVRKHLLRFIEACHLLEVRSQHK